MQRAERIDSIHAGAASRGIGGGFTGETIVIEIAAVSATNPITDETLHRIDRIDTLLRAVDETLDEAADPKGFWFRTPGWEQGRFAHVAALVRLVHDEMDRTRALLMQGAVA